MSHEGPVFEDHYAILGLEPPADGAAAGGHDAKALSRAYKKLALKWHPDKNQGNVAEATRQFDRVRKAFNVLSDPEKRRAFETEHHAKRAAAERHARLTGKRKRMKEELLERERRAAETAAANSAAARRREYGTRAPAKKRQSVADLRKTGEAQRKAMDVAIRAAAVRRSSGAAGAGISAGASSSAASGSAAIGMADTLRGDTKSTRVLSIKWKKTRTPLYTAESLRDLLVKACGAAVDNVLVGKKGNRAVVELRVSDAGYQKMTERSGSWGLTITSRQRPDLVTAHGGTSSAAEKSSQLCTEPFARIGRTPQLATASVIVSENFESAEAAILARLQQQMK